MSSTRPIDVIVIGGGIIGTSAAAHLASAGARVVLVERTAVAAGASGRNSGVVQHPFDPVLARLYHETVARYQALAAESSGAFAFPAEPVGMLCVGHDEAAARRFADELAAAHPELEPVLLPSGEARRLEPSVAPDVTAVRLPIGFPVAPEAATRAYADRAAALGVEVRVGAGASPRIVDGRVAGVTFADGTTLAAADIVVAAGPWSPGLVDPSGAWRPITRTWGVVVSVTLAAAPSHVLEEIELEIEPGDAGEPEPSAEFGFSLVPAGAASSLGSTFFLAEPHPSRVVPALIERGRGFVPGLAGAAVGADRVCARPLSADGRPLIGAVPGIDGLWIAAGHGPWGISTGPASGRLIADLVLGRQASPPAAARPGPLRTGPVGGLRAAGGRPGITSDRGPPGWRRRRRGG